MIDVEDLAEAEGSLSAVIFGLKDDVEYDKPILSFKTNDKLYIKVLEEVLATIKVRIEEELKDEFDTRTAHPRAFADEHIADMCNAR